MKKRLIALSLVVALLFLNVTPSAYAIFGIGDIVFDPSVYAEAVQQLIQMDQQYMQLVQTYQMIGNQYNQMKWMAQRVPVDMISRYRPAATRWKTSSAADAFGTTAPWVGGINTGIGVQDGYQASTLPLASYGTAFDNIPADQQTGIKTNYATVELADGVNLATMDTIGRMRGNARAMETAIQGLEDDSLSSDPAMNTETAVLNKINAANLMAVRTGQDTNKVLVALAEEQLIDAKRKRDVEAQAINNHIRFMAEGRAVMAAQAADAGAAIRAWRMP